jgi:hypothetical protein
VGNDEEFGAFISKIGKNKVVFTDNSLGRFEKLNCEIRANCLSIMKQFIASTESTVGPYRRNFKEILKLLIEAGSIVLPTVLVTDKVLDNIIAVTHAIMPFMQGVTRDERLPRTIVDLVILCAFRIMNAREDPNETIPIECGECRVCLEEMLIGDVVRTLCQHVFHARCIKKVHDTSIDDGILKCPLCRRIVSDLYQYDVMKVFSL